MLKGAVLQAVESAKAALSDLSVGAIHVRRTSMPYVPGQPAKYLETMNQVRIVVTAFRSKEVDGERVRASDQMGLLFPEEGVPVPEPNDLIQLPNATYRVLHNDKVTAGDSVALSQLHLRPI